MVAVAGTANSLLEAGTCIHWWSLRVPFRLALQDLVVTVDRIASLMINELKQFKVNIAGISETKWFGEVVYEVEGFMILHTGHPIPESIYTYGKT